MQTEKICSLIYSHIKTYKTQNENLTFVNDIKIIIFTNFLNRNLNSCRTIFINS
jgi:hypothetical protein